MINTVTLVGRIAKDVKVETVNTKNGQITKVFGQLAVDQGRKDVNGNSVADFISFEIWGKTANVIAQYTTQGSLVGLQGALRSNKYQDANGNTHFKMVVRVNPNGVSLLESKTTTQQRRANAQNQNNAFAQAQQSRQAPQQNQNNGFAQQPAQANPQNQNNGFIPANDDPFVSGNAQF